jgi:hypothetical protein
MEDEIKTIPLQSHDVVAQIMPAEILYPDIL